MGRQRAKLARAMTDIETSRMICHCVLYPVLTYIEEKREGGGNFSAAIFVRLSGTQGTVSYTHLDVYKRQV